MYQPIANPNQSGLGTLQVTAATARRTYPVANANVTVSVHGTTPPSVLYNVQTDSSGMTPALRLPGVPVALSLVPNTDFSSIADRYSYDIAITHPSFITMLYTNVVIYESITSVQNADMIPKATSPNPDRPIRFDEKTNVL